MRTPFTRAACAAAAVAALSSLGMAGPGTAGAASTAPPARALRLAASHGRGARSARPVTAYVVNAGSGPVAPIRTATGTGPGAIAVTPAPGTTGAVPASFQPAAASFVSASWGVVLGGVGCTVDGPCAARLAVTADGGRHWRFMHAPNVTLNGSGPAVRNVLLLGGTSHLWATADGTHWHRYRFGCPAFYSRTGLASISASSRSRVLFLCLGEAAAALQSKAVLASVNGGKTIRLAGIAPIQGFGGVIAVPPRSRTVITLGTESSLARSADGGRTWKHTYVDNGGEPWNYLAYPSQTTGWAEYGKAEYGAALWKTTDTGRTWHQVRFTSPPHPVTAYVVNAGSGTVTPINTATGKPLKAIRVGTDPGAIAITPDGKTAYVVNSGSNTVTPIRTATNKAGKAIKVGIGPGAIAITPDGKTAYLAEDGHVLGAPGFVVPIRTTTSTVGKADQDLAAGPDSGEPGARVLHLGQPSPAVGRWVVGQAAGSQPDARAERADGAADEQHLLAVPHRGRAPVIQGHRRDLPPPAGNRVVGRSVTQCPHRAGRLSGETARHDEFFAGPGAARGSPRLQPRGWQHVPGIGRGAVSLCRVRAPAAV
jgi:YVTN family beta-propeller protein